MDNSQSKSAIATATATIYINEELLDWSNSGEYLPAGLIAQDDPVKIRRKLDSQVKSSGAEVSMGDEGVREIVDQGGHISEDGQQYPGMPHPGAFPRRKILSNSPPLSREPSPRVQTLAGSE